MKSSYLYKSLILIALTQPAFAVQSYSELHQKQKAEREQQASQANAEISSATSSFDKALKDHLFRGKPYPVEAVMNFYNTENKAHADATALRERQASDLKEFRNQSRSSRSIGGSSGKQFPAPSLLQFQKSSSVPVMIESTPVDGSNVPQEIEFQRR